MWNDEGQVEVVVADYSPCYLQQMHVGFRIYVPNVKPITIDSGVIDRYALNVCLMEQFEVKLEDQVETSWPNNANEC